MRILLFGRNGQLGWALGRSLSLLGEVIAVDQAQCDLADATQIRQLIATTAPDLIVNAAAYTAVDKAESEADLAFAINAEAPRHMAEAASARNILLLHYSTDYVFDGKNPQPYLETDAVNPLNIYGQSKLAGEQAVQDTGCRHLIFRTSWVFSAHGSNFAKTMLRLAGERSELKVIQDQIGAPTSAELLADCSLLALRQILSTPKDTTTEGLYHVVAQGATSWYDYAKLVLATVREMGVPLRCTEQDIQPITSAEYPVAATRPLNSRLNCEKFSLQFGLVLPPWEWHVRRMVYELLTKNH